MAVGKDGDNPFERKKKTPKTEEPNKGTTVEIDVAPKKKDEAPSDDKKGEPLPGDTGEPEPEKDTVLVMNPREGGDTSDLMPSKKDPTDKEPVRKTNIREQLWMRFTGRF